MIRRDYILRMIEEFMQILNRMRALKKDQLWKEAEETLDSEFHKLIDGRAGSIMDLTETQLMALLIKGEPTQAIQTKTLMLTTLLKEAGDLATAQDKPEDSYRFYLKGLHVLLYVLAGDEIHDWPDFVPRIEFFASALKDSQLPLETQALLMQHYERAGEFAKAEDALFSMLDQDGENERLIRFGIAFYERILGQSDAHLETGNLPRQEAEASLAELRQRADLPDAAGSRS